MVDWRRKFKWVVLGVYSYTLWLMLGITMQYVSLRPDVAFLAIKQDYVPMLHYRVGFFVHVFSAIFVLLAGYTQFSSTLRRRRPRLHRRLGTMYAMVTIFLAGPSGLVIGMYANGGVSSRVSFCLLAMLWICFTVLAIAAISQRRIEAHQQWMTRSFALALSALTLRAWKYVLVWCFHPRPMDVYRIVAWLGWTLNLVVAEVLIRRHPVTKRKEQTVNESEVPFYSVDAGHSRYAPAYPGAR